MRILNVAEKNDAAKKISAILSQGKATRTPGRSVYNQIYQFKMNYQGMVVDMVVTSVTGHLMNMNIDPAFKSWHSCDPCTLMNPRTKVLKEVTPDSDNIARTLQDEARRAQQLFLWLDGDREGENIAFEVIQCCSSVNRSLSIRNGTIKRARFSEFTQRAIMSAINTLGPPNERLSLAVDARQELDLRVGAAFTRFQTLHLRDRFANLPENVISYGPCQFPTLGFVVQRYLRRKNFVVEPFWGLSINYKRDNKSVSFSWCRGNLFDRMACVVLFEIVMENPTATVQKILKKEQRRWRPVPLNTVEMQKLAARKLNTSSHKAMNTAEALYNKGLISYPRTETDFYTLNEEELKAIIREQERDNTWGEYSARLIEGEFKLPRKGKNNDNAHPPIHPTKHPGGENLSVDERNLYELITRHFLASCSDDAIGHETVITINIAGELFSTVGLMVSKLNWLEIFKYEKWTDKDIPVFTENEQFEPTEIRMTDGQTQPPPLLSEADLIGLMDKNGIGTDATIAQHIETIQKRSYAAKKGNVFEPTELGLALVEAYDSMGFELSKPNLRAKTESEMTEISRGTRSKDEMVQTNLQMYEFILRDVTKKKDIMEKVVGKYFKHGNSNDHTNLNSNKRPRPESNQQQQGTAMRQTTITNFNNRNSNNNNNSLNRTNNNQSNMRQFSSFNQNTNNNNNNTNYNRNTSNSNNNNYSSNAANNPSGSNNNSSNNGNMLCLCGEPVRVFTSKTEKSKGKQFAKCPKPQNEQCKYFEWIENDDPQ